MRFFRDDRGLTLTELLVVVSLMSIVIGVAYFVLHAVTNMADGNIARAAASDQAQLFVDRAGRELRQAMEAEEGQGAFVEISPRKIVFYSDVTNDTIPERITYFVENGSVYRTQATTSDTITPFKNFSGESAKVKLVDTVDPAWSDPIFTYWDETNTAVTNSAYKAAVARVDVVMRAQAKSGQRESVSHQTITARLRSVHNVVGGF